MGDENGALATRVRGRKDFVALELHNSLAPPSTIQVYIGEDVVG